jgi:23S rRNA G2445 N2-methylase RlmL
VQNLQSIASRLPCCKEINTSIQHNEIYSGYLSYHVSSAHFSTKDVSLKHKNHRSRRAHDLQKPSNTSIKDKLGNTETPKQGYIKKYTKPKQQPLEPPFSLFASCLPGLEPILHQEIHYLQSTWTSNDNTAKQSAQYPRAVAGGVEITVPSLAHLYLLRLYLGCASHIYLRLNEDKPKKYYDANTCAQIPPLFSARGFPELERKLQDLIIAQQWSQWLGVSSKESKRSTANNSHWDLQVHVTTSKSKLIHTKAVEERVRKVVGRVLGLDLEHEADRDFQKPIVRIFVRIERDVVQLSLDVTSVPMHMRGYRKNPHKAPLREDLAYALLMSGGLKPNWNLEPLQSFFGGLSTPATREADGTNVCLFDPCCGSGTIAIEGAGILAGLPPGRHASAPLQGTSFCDHKLWDVMKQSTLSGLQKGVCVTANDIEQTAIDAAKLNAQEAGVADYITFTKGSFQRHKLFEPLRSETASPRLLVVVTNPPYGQRLSSAGIYKTLAKSISSSKDLIRYTLIGKDPRQMRETGLPLEVTFSTKSGGLSIVAMSGTQLHC